MSDVVIHVENEFGVGNSIRQKIEAAARRSLELQGVRNLHGDLVEYVIGLPQNTAQDTPLIMTCHGYNDDGEDPPDDELEPEDWMDRVQWKAIELGYAFASSEYTSGGGGDYRLFG